MSTLCDSALKSSDLMRSPGEGNGSLSNGLSTGAAGTACGATPVGATGAGGGGAGVTGGWGCASDGSRRSISNSFEGRTPSARRRFSGDTIARVVDVVRPVRNVGFAISVASAGRCGRNSGHGTNSSVRGLTSRVAWKSTPSPSLASPARITLAPRIQASRHLSTSPRMPAALNRGITLAIRATAFVDGAGGFAAGGAAAPGAAAGGGDGTCPGTSSLNEHVTRSSHAIPTAPLAGYANTHSSKLKSSSQTPIVSTGVASAQ